MQARTRRGGAARPPKQPPPLVANDETEPPKDAELAPADTPVRQTAEAPNPEPTPQVESREGNGLLVTLWFLIPLGLLLLWQVLTGG